MELLSLPLHALLQSLMLLRRPDLDQAARDAGENLLAEIATIP